MHRCLVLELLGPTVDQSLKRYLKREEKLKPETVLRMLGQLLEGIKFIHDAGMEHGANVKLYRLFWFFISIHSILSLCDVLIWRQI